MTVQQDRSEGIASMFNWNSIVVSSGHWPNHVLFFTISMWLIKQMSLTCLGPGDKIYCCSTHTLGRCWYLFGHPPGKQWLCKAYGLNTHVWIMHSHKFTAHNGACPTNGGSVIQDQRVGTIQLLFQSDPLFWFTRQAMFWMYSKYISANLKSNLVFIQIICWESVARYLLLHKIHVKEEKLFRELWWKVQKKVALSFWTRFLTSFRMEMSQKVTWQ